MKFGSRFLTIPVLAAVHSLSCVQTQAQFSYSTNSGGIVITRYAGIGDEVNIPDTINGLAVTCIGDTAFAGTSITSVTIPKSVGRIGSSAFNYCLRLTTVTLSDNISSIGESAFAFCLHLTTAPIPNGVSHIPGGAFQGCTGLTKVRIPQSVSHIGDGAFQACVNLTEVTIPNGVTYIGRSAFSECNSLRAFNVAALNSAYCGDSGVLLNKSQTKLIVCPRAKLGGYPIPNSVANIEDYAFSESSLTTLIIPKSVTAIGNSAFHDCVRLMAVYFDGNLPTVGSEAFSGCTNATLYRLPGTSGWGPTVEGLSVALWTPQVENKSANFGVLSAQFGFTVTWARNMTVIVEACTDLGSSSWVPLATNILAGGSSYFIDPQWTNHPGRFYRLRGR